MDDAASQSAGDVTRVGDSGDRQPWRREEISASQSSAQALGPTPAALGGHRAIERGT
jgi:hypothetical protein